jgi:hypothetical protein
VNPAARKQRSHLLNEGEGEEPAPAASEPPSIRVTQVAARLL